MFIALERGILEVVPSTHFQAGSLAHLLLQNSARRTAYIPQLILDIVKH